MRQSVGLTVELFVCDLLILEFQGDKKRVTNQVIDEMTDLWLQAYFRCFPWDRPYTRRMLQELLRLARNNQRRFQLLLEGIASSIRQLEKEIRQ